MLAWSNFVVSADAKDIHIMLDAPFNTAHDVELAQKGVELFQPDGEQWNSYDEIRNLNFSHPPQIMVIERIALVILLLRLIDMILVNGMM